jgi:hypothetical protein
MAAIFEINGKLWILVEQTIAAAAAFSPPAPENRHGAFQWRTV